MKRARHTIAFVTGMCFSAMAFADPYYVEWLDFPGDHTIRETDSVGPQHFNVNALPDLLSLRISAWEATDPANDPYTGEEVDPAIAHLFKVDLVVNGLLNPPGPIGLGVSPFDPYRFGDRPIYGFIEFDLDGNIDSGGELESTAMFRFLGNAARFGGLPTGEIGARTAKSASDYDGVFQTAPQFERTGAEMAFVFCGCFAPTLIEEIGDDDGIMEFGETHIVRGRFLERMQALRSYSGVFGGSDFGLYDPEIEVKFSHDPDFNRTTITFVYALDAVGAAALRGETAAPLDSFVANQSSVHEMLRDIALTASGCCGPVFNDPAVFPLVFDWISPNFPNVPLMEQELLQYLNPTQWTATAIIGTTYDSPQTGLYVWTDLGFNWQFADLNSDGASNTLDESLLEVTIVDLDGTMEDADGAQNGVVLIANHGENFNLFDLTNDGQIDDDDVSIYGMAQLADLTGDGFVDGADLATLLASWGNCSGCAADLNGDGVVDGVDTANLLANWTP